ncbi:MAG: hypothetical protein MJA31_07315 [Clostridia bacterium]|nr:hypothetical protein [Clostridia bacterium]
MSIKEYKYTYNSHNRSFKAFKDTTSSPAGNVQYVRWNVIDSKPAERVKPPSRERIKEVKYLDEDQTGLFLAALSNESLKYKLVCYLGLFAGMRRSEILGL